MPVELERKLRAEGRRKGYTGARLDAYVYGTLENLKKKRKRKNAARRR